MRRSAVEAVKKSIPRGRRKLSAVIRDAGDIIKIDNVVSTLSVGRPDAAKLLSRWAGQGWLRRVGPGAYVPVQLDSLESDQVLDDPWILVPVLYGPAYIGGWSAAEHWGLTEQLFRRTLVVTLQTVRIRHQIRHGAHFLLRHTQERKFFGTQAVWRGQSRILISDVHRTMIDMLDDPATGGGSQHVADCLDLYLKRADRNDEVLIGYARKISNGAVFKRLGFLTEKHADAVGLTEACREHLTQGNAMLDPALECPRLISQWRLQVPANWTSGGVHD